MIPTNRNSILHIYSDILFGILSDTCSDILSGIHSDILFGILSDISYDILSGTCSWHIFWHSFWHSIWNIFGDSLWSRSGWAHFHPAVALRVRRGPLRSSACSWGPAGTTLILGLLPRSRACSWGSAEEEKEEEKTEEEASWHKI